MAKSFTENKLYDYESAREAGMGPQGTPGPNQGHWSSRVSSGPKEGLMLKDVNHPTFNLGVEGEKKMGYKMSSDAEGRIWSQPPDKPLAPGHTPLTYVNPAVDVTDGYKEKK